MFDQKVKAFEEKKKVYQTNYFFLIKMPLLSNEEFKSHFRLTKTTFESLLNVVGPSLSKPVRGRPKIDFKKQALIAIWTLSNQESYRGIADRFDIERGHCHRLFFKFVLVLYSKRTDFIRFPTGEMQKEVKQGFRRLRNTPFPGCVGCCDGCHIPIKQPQKDKQSFYNRNKYHSILLQGICDHRSVFTDVFVGWPGSSHDANVWKQSPIFKSMMQTPLYSEEDHLLGDSAYPNSKLILVPFRNNGHMTEGQKRFNKILSSTRCVIEQAFGMLKGRFRRLKMLDMSRMDMLAKFVVVGCVLHNICLINDDLFDFEVDEFEIENEKNVEESNEGSEKRDRIAQYFAANN